MTSHKTTQPLTPAELAAHLGICKKTLLTKRTDIPRIYVSPHRWRYDLSEVTSYLKRTPPAAMATAGGAN